MKSLQKTPHLASSWLEPPSMAWQCDTGFLLRCALGQALTLLAGGTPANPTKVMGELNSLVPLMRKGREKS